MADRVDKPKLPDKHCPIALKLNLTIYSIEIKRFNYS